MNTPPEVTPADDEFVWERPEPISRPAPTPLSREQIVQAAVAIADAEGLAAVSLRRVGAALGATAMRLYGYLSTKEELLALMIDAVYGEIAAAGPIAGDWRDALRAMARRVRHAMRAHPWAVHLLGGRPHLGPNALAFTEASFAALTGTAGFEDVDVAMQALRTVNAYVTGAIQREASEPFRARGGGPRGTPETGAYLRRMLATGRFPNLARVVGNAGEFSADVVFDRGLEWVLDGIAAQLPR